LLRTKFDRSAERRDQLDDVRSGKVFREVSAYSDFLDYAWGAESSDARLQKVSGSKMATGQTPQRLRKSFDLPALVAIARAKCHPLNWSFSRVRLPRLHRCTRSLVQLARSSLVASFTLAVPLSVLSCCHLRGEPRLRDLDAAPRYPYDYRSRSDNRLESVAYAHTAADLHVRPVSRTALVRDRGRCEQLTNTPWGAGRNEIDSKIFAATTAHGMPQQGRCSPRKSNALIHFADSTRAATVTFSSKWKIKVTPPS